MEQNKYREQIQNGFINPSKSSWEKLYQKLDEHDQSKNKSYRKYLKYAASLVFIVSLGFYFISTDHNSKIEIIESKQVEQISIQPLEIEQNNNFPLENQSGIKLATITQTDNSLTYQEEKEIDIQEKKSSDTFEFEEHLQDLKNVMNEVPFEPEINLDYEVEELMRIANLNLEKGNQNLNSDRIMAMDLLGEVENDLKNDHRRKLFEKITITIKNPDFLELADRNK